MNGLRRDVDRVGADLGVGLAPYARDPRHSGQQRTGAEGRGAVVTVEYTEAPTKRHRVGVGGTAFVSEGVELSFGRCDLEKVAVRWPSGLESSVEAPPEGMNVITEGE